MAAEAGFNVCNLYPSLKFLEIFSVLSQVDQILQEILDEHRQKMEKSSDYNSNNNVGREEEEDDIVDVLLRIQRMETLKFHLLIPISKLFSLNRNIIDNFRMGNF